MSDQQGPIKGFRPLNTPPGSPVTPQGQPVPDPAPVPQTPPAAVPAYSAPAAPGPVCTNCRTINPPGSVFCVNCGTPVSAPQPVAAAAAIVCPQCTAPIQPGAQFCIYCGYRVPQQEQGGAVSAPAVPPAPAARTYVTATPVASAAAYAPARTKAASGSILWPAVTVAGALLAVVGFFLPLLRLVLEIPTGGLSALFGGSGENLWGSISMSPWQMLTLSMPTMDGFMAAASGLMGMTGGQSLADLIALTGDPQIEAGILMVRVLMLLLGVLALAGLALALLTFSRKGGLGRWAGLLAGVIGALMVIVITVVAGASFEKVVGDLDSLTYGLGVADSIINLNNGAGFWAMLLGFIGVGFGSFKKK